MIHEDLSLPTGCNAVVATNTSKGVTEGLLVCAFGEIRISTDASMGSNRVSGTQGSNGKFKTEEFYTSDSHNKIAGDLAKLVVPKCASCPNHVSSPSE